MKHRPRLRRELIDVCCNQNPTAETLVGLLQALCPPGRTPIFHPYVGGFLLGLLLFLAFFFTGNGLGASGGLNRIVVFFEDLAVPGHVDRTYLITMAGGDKNPLDNWVVPVVLGALAGGFVSGWRNGRVKVETNRGPNISTRTRWGMAFLGGAIMGYGARFARGCTPARPSQVERRCRSARGPSCSPFSPGHMRWRTSCASCGTKR